MSVNGTASPLKLKPAPDAEAAVTVTLEPPVFFKVTACDALLPTVTLPKPMLVGLAVRFPAATAVPATGMFNVGFCAFDVTATLPLKLPAVWGANFTLNVTLWPAPRVTGSVIPETLKPVPVAVTAVTWALAPPVFLIVSVWLEFCPTSTFVNVRLVGFAVSVAGVNPNPARGISSSGSPEIVSATLPLAEPEIVGAKATLKVAV